ncbi:unnamed protein product [Adineta steineri]|uniref:Uncharacterized protein n=2 Tax=Adineta steineri TaxID=433720 RepID=A0A814MJV4_9BILA|nr:unnamed protein product [Adineta steineri]
MKIYSKTFKILDKTMNLVQLITFQRAARQFGTYLNKQTSHINCGIDEIDDHIVIYMPNENVLFAADNIYAICDTTTRDPLKWISSLDLMRNFHVEYFIPSHTKLIVGKNEIYQTIRFVNKGLTPDEIIGNKLIQLPPRLKQHPYLQEFFIFIGVYVQYLDWFSGKTSALNLDSPKI